MQELNFRISMITALLLAVAGTAKADEQGPYTKNVAGVPNASVFNTDFDIEGNGR